MAKPLRRNHSAPGVIRVPALNRMPPPVAVSFGTGNPEAASVNSSSSASRPAVKIRPPDSSPKEQSVGTNGKMHLPSPGANGRHGPSLAAACPTSAALDDASAHAGINGGANGNTLHAALAMRSEGQVRAADAEGHEVPKASQFHGRSSSSQSLPLMLEHKESATQEFFTATLEPGTLGLGLCWSTGEVMTMRQDGQALDKGIKVGMRFHKIDGDDYAEGPMRMKIAGKERYEAVFVSEVVVVASSLATENGMLHGGQVVLASSSVTENGDTCSFGSSDTPNAKFWKPVVGRLYERYLEGRLQDFLRTLLHLDVLHWRQLFEFYYAVRAFLKLNPSEQSMKPPALPADVLMYIVTNYFSGQGEPPVESVPCEPLWHIEAMVLVRLLIGGKSSPGACESAGLPVPPLVAQFVVHMLSSAAATEFFFTAGMQGYEAAWTRHGSDVLLAVQHNILRLFPEESCNWPLEGANPLPERVPSILEVVATASLQFSAHLMIVSSSSGDQAGWESSSHEVPEAAHTNSSNGRSLPRPRFGLFPAVMHCLGLLSRASVATRRVGDRFLLCLGDVLYQLLGAPPESSSVLPEPVPSLSPMAGRQPPKAPDIKDLVRIVRVILHALNADPARLAASERNKALPNGADASKLAALGVDMLSAGSSTLGPSEPGDFVPILEQGPLRRSLVFMEQSALLQMVQSKLLAASFADVVGDAEQLSLFALRNINVLWFDLRRCTSTLKPVDDASGIAGGASAVLVLRHLRLGLSHDWEAKLATFPYLALSGASRVTVKNLVISVRFSVSHCTGVALQEVDVGIPDLDIQLTCASALFEICVSVLLELLQDTLKEHIQKQLNKHLEQLLVSEFDKWNTSVWAFLKEMIPEHLICRSLKWVGSAIPPEGLPV